MTRAVMELYDALVSAGISDDLAKRAAQAVMSIEDGEQLVTKADLRAEIANLKADLTRLIITVLLGMTAIFSAISAAFRFVK